MDPQYMMEGTGEEIAKYAKRHPRDRFQLIVVPSAPVEKKTHASSDLEKLKALIPGYAFFKEQPEDLLDRIEAVSQEIRTERLRKLA